MNKQQFLDTIRDKIGALPPQDRERSLDFYSEIIDDRMEDGLTEEQALEAIGSVEEVAAQILQEAQVPKAAPVIIPRKLRIWEIVLLVLGAPLWIPLVLSVAIVLLSVYAVLWSCVLTLYCADLCLALGAVAGIAGGIFYLITGGTGPALLFIGVALVLAGLAIVAFFLCNLAAKGVFLLSKYAFLSMKALIIRKETKK